MRRLARLLALASALLATPALAKPPVWVVRDRDSEMVIFGSVHVLPHGADWKPVALARALKRADDVWFELPPGSGDTSARLAAELGTLPPDQSLFRILTAEDGERLIAAARAYGVDPAVLARLRPWTAELALAGAVYRRAEADVSDGVEQAVEAEAPTSARRCAFETPGEQIQIMAETPLAEQIASLNQTVADLETPADEYAALVDAWMKGDLRALDEEAVAPLREVAPTLYKHLVTDRNARWTQTLDARLRGKGRTVVVVGVGHLIGPNGVPARLRALGYSVKGP